MNEMTILKMNLLGGMNSYLEAIGDEYCLTRWYLTFPDCADEDDLREIVEDEELWRECCGLFGDICKIMEVI